MPLILDLEREYRAAKADPAFTRRVRRSARTLCRPPQPALFRRAADRGAARERAGGQGRASLFQARRAQPHRRAQDQQLHRPDPARDAAWARRGSSPRPAPASTASPPPPSRALRPALRRSIMGASDVERQQPNVFRMKLLGAEVVPGRQRRADAQGRDERGAARLGRERPRHLLHHRHRRRPASLSRAGPRLPERDRHARRASRCSKPRAACPTCWSRRSAADRTRSGCSTRSSTMPTSKMLGVEAAGHGLDTAACREPRRRLARRPPRQPTYLLQDEDGQITEAHSISAGLDYPGIGPEHSWLHEIGRVDYTRAPTTRRSTRFQLLCRTEGIIPALEPSHAIAAVAKRRARRWTATRSSSPTSAGAATRTSSPSPRRWGWRCEAIMPIRSAARPSADRGCCGRAAAVSDWARCARSATSAPRDARACVARSPLLKRRRLQ